MKLRSHRISLEFKVNDIWIGVFWKTSTIGTFPGFFGGKIDLRCRDIWICLIPMLPIHIMVTWEDAERPKRREEALKEIAQVSQELGLYD